MYALVDCNNFFVSCERLFRPDLGARPVVVLSNNDGCFVSRSQEAKDLGLPMGAPLFKYRDIVRQHDVVLFSANFELYGDISQRLVELMHEVTPLIEVYSIDECFLDLSELKIGDYDEWANDLRHKTLKEIGIPVSIGIAPTKTLAKVASSYAKKHQGVLAITDDKQREAVLKDYPIEDIWGIGWRTAPKLREVGISKASQLLAASQKWLEKQFTITGLRMIDELRGVPRLAFGDKSDTRKQIMVSRSFGHKVQAYYQLESAISTFAAKSAVKLRRQNSVCSQVVVFISTGKNAEEPRHVGVTVSLPEPTMDTAKLIKAALQGLDDIYDGEFSYSKAGVVLTSITSVENWQLSLIGGDKKRDKHSSLMKSVDKLNSRYGSVIWYASEKTQNNIWQSKHDSRSPSYTTSWVELPKLKG